ncbi:MAG: Stk1 family PASTA domain-containing Ser/Thr kinase [Clostridiaceae bacterium]
MIGTILGNRYEILEKIGEGGMAYVYKAKCHLLNRFVAVKILKDEYINNQEFLEKFKMEATAAASLSNNNIVNIYDIGTEGNISYIVMEYVEGETLKKRIKRNGRLKIDETLDFAISIARALEAAHNNNIIHRDIKPQNILVTKNGAIKVADFGIAKASSSVTMTNTNQVLGSAHYFSPEQARGSYIDKRTDIYSLGIVLYEMVTGNVPYDADSPVSIALKHIQEKVLEPKFLNENINNNLNNLILKAIEKDPINRYQNIREMLYDLIRIKENPETIINTDKKEEDEYTKVMSPIKIDDDEINKRSKNNEKTKPKNKTKKIVAIVSISILSLFLIFFIAYKNFYTPKTNSVAVPSIVGLPEEQAKKIVEDANLKFVVSSSIESDLDEGLVVKTSPEEGQSVKINSNIKVYLSSGKGEITVPNITNINETTARSILENYELKVGTVEYDFNDDVLEGNVISQSIEANTTVSKDTEINLKISKGAQINLSKVPDLIGKSLTEAKNLLEANSLKLGKTKEIPNEIDASSNGLIISQDISKGNDVNEDSEISVNYYGNYVEEIITFDIPNFKNKYKTIDKALDTISKLEDNGFIFEYYDSDGNLFQGDLDKYPIISQDKDAGEYEPQTIKINLDTN